MANKKKSVSFSAFKAAATGDYKGIVVVPWNDIEVEIKRHLSLLEVLNFVALVTQAAFDDDGAYMPERIDAAILACTIEFYTNINLGKDPFEAYDLIYQSGISDVIMENIDRDQFDRIIRAAIKKIDNTANANIQAVTKQVNELSAAFENMESSMASLVEGITPDELRGMIGALSSGTIDEKKLVEAIADRK